MKNTDIKHITINFLNAIGVVTIAYHITSNYEVMTQWWHFFVIVGLIGLLAAVVDLVKPVFAISLTGNFILFFNLQDNLNLNLNLPTTDIIDYLIKFLIMLVLVIITEIIVTDDKANVIIRNILFDIAFAILTLILYLNVGKLISNYESWIPLLKVFILFIYSIVVVMSTPMQWRKFTTGKKSE